MPRKPKFKPKITRIKLNPEQAVLSCSCVTNTRTIDYDPDLTYGIEAADIGSRYCFGANKGLYDTTWESEWGKWYETTSSPQS